MKKTNNWKSWLLFVSTIFFTLLASFFVKLQIDNKDEAEFKFECKEISSKIDLRLHAHAQLLRSGTAFFDASDSVNREDWHNFISHSKVNLNLPGILGTGFSMIVPKDKIAQHNLRIRNEGFPNYKVWPEHPRDIYSSIIFLEPFSGANQRAFGYDMMTEAVRKEAMERARDMNIAALSGKVLLVQETKTDVQAGNLMYIPVYKKGLKLESIEQRRAAIKGWVYSPYRMNDLMLGILKNWEINDNNKIFYLQIFDEPDCSSESLLFESHLSAKQKKSEKIRFYLQIPIDFNGKLWTLRFSQSKQNVLIDYLAVWLVFLGGVLISFLLLFLSRLLIGTRIRALKIAETLTSELKESESLLRESNEIASLGTYELDFRTNEWKSSEILDQILGIDESYKRSLAGWEQLLHPDYKEATIAHLNKNVIQEKQTFDKQYKIIRKKDQKERWVHGLGKLELDSNNKPLKLLGTIRDITEQKHAEERLRLSQEQYSIAVEGSNDGIWDWNIIANEVYFSPRWKGILGYKENELLNVFKTWEELLHPEDLNRALSNIQAYFANEISEYVEEFRMLHKDGTYRWILARGKALRYKNGKPYRMAGSHTDITSRKLYEEKIKTLSIQNKLILDSVGEGIYGLDLEGKITFVNPAAALMIGNTAENLIGQQGHADHHHSYLDGSVYPPEACPIYAVLKTGITTHTENEVFWRKNGTSFPVEYICTPLRNDLGKLIGSVVVFKDITQRKQVEKELMESEKQLRSIIEASPVPMVITKIKEGQIIMANESLGKLFKISLANAQGQKSPDFYANPEQRSELLKGLQKYGFINNFELILKKSDGEQFWCSVSLKIMNLENEQVMISGFHDITERKKAEEEITKHREHLEEMVLERTRELTISEQKLQQSVKDITDYKIALDESSLVTITDVKGIILFANDNYCKISKYNREELLGKNHRLLNAGYHSKDFFTELWETVSKGKSWRNEIKNKAKDDSYYWLDASIIPFLDENGNPYQYMTIGSDITSRKMIEADLIKAKEVADSANIAKSEFLANMSHEIRTPMNAVIGFSDLLSKSIKVEKQKSQIESIRSSGKTLLKIINDILDLSKIEAGKIDIEPTPVNLLNLVREVENMFAPKVEEKGIHFAIGYEDQTHKAFLLDEVRLRQILFNLIGNAIKFTDKGRVYVSVYVYKNKINKEKIDLSIKIEDSAMGIPLDQQELIFEPFYQHTGQSSKYGGTGLGLPITKKLIEKMGGSISLESKVGKGSIFTVIIPSVAIVKDEIVSTENIFDYAAIRFKKAKILLVDDNAENKKLIIDMLEYSQLSIIEANNGIEAIKIAQEQVPNLILMDLRMPVMNGHEASKILKRMQKTKLIPIIAISASTTKINEKSESKNNIDEYLMKPIEITELFDKMKKYLKHETIDKIASENTEKSQIRLTEEQINRLPELVSQLENDFLPIYNKVTKSQMIDEIEKFGKDLQILAKKGRIEYLLTYANDICFWADNFEIDKLLKALEEFPTIVAYLKMNRPNE